MTVVKVFQKAAAERRRLYIDYSCWLEDTEALTDIQVTITPYTVDTPITITTSYTDSTNKKLTMYAAGGGANTSYVLSLVVSTDQGQVKKDDIGLRVTP
jgi:hypothetical protein